MLDIDGGTHIANRMAAASMGVDEISPPVHFITSLVEAVVANRLHFVIANRATLDGSISVFTSSRR